VHVAPLHIIFCYMCMAYIVVISKHLRSAFAISTCTVQVNETDKYYDLGSMVPTISESEFLNPI